jgi:hypothetical protein
MIDRHIAFAAAGLVVAGERGDAFQQSRLTRAVLADDDGDGVLKVELEALLQEQRAERIGRRLLTRSVGQMLLRYGAGTLEAIAAVGHARARLAAAARMKRR